VHEGGWRVDWWGEGRPVFFDPRGGTHFEGRWSPPALDGAPVEDLDGDPVEGPDCVSAETLHGDPVEALEHDPVEALEHDPVGALQRDNRSCGADPDWRTAGARWKRLEDVPEEVLFRALEAT